MTIVVDASALYAQIDRDEPLHEPVTDILRTDPGPFVTTEMVVAEVDHLVLARFDTAVELDFLTDLVDGTFSVECLSRDELAMARQVLARYADLRIGLADASLVVLARRFGTRRMLSLDERAFRAVRPLQGGSFTILPADTG